MSVDELVAAVDVKLASLSCPGGVASGCHWGKMAGGALYLAGRGGSSVVVGVGGVLMLLGGADGRDASSVLGGGGLTGTGLKGMPCWGSVATGG